MSKLIYCDVLTHYIDAYFATYNSMMAAWCIG